MEQNTRPAPDNDLEAYGDWVTVDSAVIPAAAVRQPPAATADVETAVELTGAEEEFLGRVSEADHAAAGAIARDAGHPVYNGNGNGEPESGIGHPGAHAGAGAATDTTAASRADEPSRSPGIGRRADLSEQPPPSDRLALAAGAAASAADLGAAGPTRRGGIAASAVPAPPAVVVPAPLPAVPAPPAVQPTAVPAEDYATAPANSVADQPAPSTEKAPESGGGRLADLERRVATLESQVAALADGGAPPAGAGLLQAGGDAGEVHVSIEELDSESAHEGAAPGAQAPDAAQAADAAHAAAQSDSQLAPMIRLVPIDGDEHAAALSAEGDAEASAGAAAAAGEPRTEASPAPADESFRNDVRAVLRYLDQLLDDLPPERVREFAQSSHFATYKALFTELGLDE